MPSSVRCASGSNPDLLLTTDSLFAVAQWGRSTALNDFPKVCSHSVKFRAEKGPDLVRNFEWFFEEFIS
jgi:hypothetical protein